MGTPKPCVLRGVSIPSDPKQNYFPRRCVTCQAVMLLVDYKENGEEVCNVELKPDKSILIDPDFRRVLDNVDKSTNKM